MVYCLVQIDVQVPVCIWHKSKHNQRFLTGLVLCYWSFWDQHNIFLIFNHDLSSFGNCDFPTSCEWNLNIRFVWLPAAEICAFTAPQKNANLPFSAWSGSLQMAWVLLSLLPSFSHSHLDHNIQAISDLSIFYAVLLDIFVSLKSKRYQMEAPCSSSMIISSILLWGCVTYVHKQLKMLLPCMNCVCSRAQRRLRK